MKTKVYAKVINGTDPGSRLGNEEEREKVTEHDAGEDCTKLSTGCLDELMLVVNNHGASWSSMVCRTISLA